MGSGHWPFAINVMLSLFVVIYPWTAHKTENRRRQNYLRVGCDSLYIFLCVYYYYYLRFHIIYPSLE